MNVREKAGIKGEQIFEEEQNRQSRREKFEYM